MGVPRGWRFSSPWACMEARSSLASSHPFAVDGVAAPGWMVVMVEIPYHDELTRLVGSLGGLSDDLAYCIQRML